MFGLRSFRVGEEAVACYGWLIERRARGRCAALELDRERMRSWRRANGSEATQYCMSVDDVVTDIDELRAASEAKMRITIHAGRGPRSVTSLAFLAPIIGEVRDLRIGTVNRITDVEVLNGARRLRSLSFAVGSCDGRLELSDIPQLEEFRGPVTRAVSSVLKNPALRFLEVEGPVPKSFALVAGPIENYKQEGGRFQAELPAFAQPRAMRSLSRIGPVAFDFGQVSEMTELVDLEVSLCKDLVGLSKLSRLRSLARLTLKGVATRERWEDLPAVRWGFMNDVSPVPSKEFLAERRQMGWRVPAAPRDPEPALTVDEAGDGESWGVFLSRFDDLAEAVDLLNGLPASGVHGEQFLLGVVAELRSQGEELDPEPDSEGGFTAVYFPDRRQAEQVYVRARELLTAEPAAQLSYLQGGDG